MSDKKHILIVDDDPDQRLGLHIRLKANNFSTSFAADAMTSIVEARKQAPDLIILDLGLPAGDGFVVMDRLKNITQLALVPVIVVSARSPEPNRQRALQAGAKAYLRKPVDNDELLAVIQLALGAQEA
ncbi:MAG TPA: response regulator transcription factor [Candidatus Angelobacter sp.]|jgi:two-component system KDP operon response regulator KdpE